MPHENRIQEKPARRSLKGVPQSRKTHAERGQELAAMGALKTRIVDIEGLSIYLNTPVNTIRKAIGKLPRKWASVEALKAEMAKGFVSPPAIQIGKKDMFDLNVVDKFYTLYP
jgi:hypothetical protein